MNILPYAISGVIFLILIILFIGSRNAYDDFLSIVDEKEHRFKFMYPMSCFLLEIIKFNFEEKKMSKIKRMMIEIYNEKNSEYFVKIHYIMKTAYAILGIAITGFLLACMGSISLEFIAFFTFITVILYLSPDIDLKKQLKAKRDNILVEFPEFLNKFVLLLGAGLTVNQAIKVVVLNNKKKNPLYDELSDVLDAKEKGVPIHEALETFAFRCRLREISMFVSTVVQNLKKGNDEMAALLRLQANIAWQGRKNNARKIGEEAKTKLILPLMLMFISIVVMLVAPAIILLNQ